MTARSFSAVLKALAILGLAAFLTAPTPRGLETATAPSGCGMPRLDRMIGQMILVGFSGVTDTDPAVRAVREQLDKGAVGGVVLFPENIRSRDQVKNLIAFLRNARSQPRPFIAVDQEGGKVQRLNRGNGFKWFPSAQSVALNPSLASPGVAERLYGEMADELAEVGFNMNLGPVVDLNMNPSNPVIGARGRSFSDDPATVTALAAAFIKGHRAKKIATVAKHFPGHGSSRVDSHKRLADVSETWREIELEPYRRLNEEGLLDAVMLGHLYHPRFSDLDDVPASLSLKATRALRSENWLGFDGVIVSDDMEMGAVRNRMTPQELAVKAVQTGTDLLVFSNVKNRDPEIGPKIHAALMKGLCEGHISRQRVEQAYERIMALKESLKGQDRAAASMPQ
jgi:beta-N-acetylhexosaminidase